MEILNRLLEAIETGEVLNIKYNGGSQPGALREIAPISISNDKVSARCLTSNSTKTFYIEKIILSDFNSSENHISYDNDFVEIAKYEDLNSFYKSELNSLLNLGWRIENSEDSLSLHKTFKNGRLINKSEVSLQYEEFACDFVVDAETGKINAENIRKRERPWTLRATKMTTKTYSKLDKAIEVFLIQSKLLAPIQK